MKRKPGIVFRYPNGEERRWTPETYSSPEAGYLGEPIYADPKKCPFKEPPAQYEEGSNIRVIYTHQQNEWSERMRAEQSKRFVGLFQYFDISMTEPRAWEKLAFRLAEEHVPGFQLTSEKPTRKTKPGRPKKMAAEHAEVSAVVDAVRKELRAGGREVSLLQAAAAVVRRHPTKFKDRKGLPVTAASLKTRYYQAREFLRKQAEFRDALARIMGYKN